MIKINLAKKIRRGGGGGLDLKNLSLSGLLGALKSRGGGGGGSKIDIKNNPLIKLAVIGISIYIIDDAIVGFKADTMKAIEKQITVIQKDTAAIEKKMQQYSGYDKLKKELEAEEKSVRTKLEVLGKLMSGRTTPSKILKQISETIPAEVWLTEMKVTSDTIALSGQTPGYPQVSDFLGAIMASSYFSDVNLQGIEESTQPGQGVKIQNFQISGKRRSGM